MESLSQANQVNSPLPYQTHPIPKQKSNLPLVLIAVGLLVALSSVTYYFFSLQSLKQNNNYIFSNDKNQNISCNLSNQLSDSEPSNFKIAPAAPSPELGEQKVIGRLLKKNPLVVEIYDVDPWSEDTTNSLGILDEMTLNKSDESALKLLQFNDLFEAKRYGYLYASFELSKGSGLYDIRKIENIPNYYHKDISKFTNPSGTLIQYTSEEIGKLIIYNDGTALYTDKNGNLFKDISYSSEQINNLLKSFASADFNALQSKDQSPPQDIIILACNRYQRVPINENTDTLQPVIKNLNDLINISQKETRHIVKYELRKKVEIIPWTVDVDLDTVGNLHNGAFEIYKKTNQVQKNHLTYTKIPDELWSKIPSQYEQGSIYEGPYFSQNNRVFWVTKGKCITGGVPDLCKENTLYVISASAFKPPELNSGGLQIWPIKTEIKLSELGSEGVELNSENYSNNKEFYDQISGSFYSNNYFLEDNYLYEGVHIVKLNTDQKKLSEDHKPYKLKVYSKSQIEEWAGTTPLSNLVGLYAIDKEGNSTEPKFSQIKGVIANKIPQFLKDETQYYYKDKDKYYYIYGNHSGGSETVAVFISEIEPSRPSYSRGYLHWNDSDIKLSLLHNQPIVVSQKVVDQNKLKTQFSPDKYYIENNHIYILQLTNEPK